MSSALIQMRNRVRKVVKLMRHNRTLKQRLRYVTDSFSDSLPALPAEIWFMIIREATIMDPHPLDTSRGVSFLDSPQCRLSDYRDAMRDRRNMCMVNRLWNSFAQEILYEFVWISTARQAKALALTLLCEACAHAQTSGRFIRRLHIETPILERCAPEDLGTILEYTPNLLVYSDYRSLRRGTYTVASTPRSSPENLFSALTHPNNSLRRLSWTNYDADVSFHIHMSPKLRYTAAHLEYLELTLCAPSFPSLFSSVVEAAVPPPAATSISLPALRSLKITLDNTTFAALATWTLPVLTYLSVVSADFSYAGAGFSEFFRVHGPKLDQLELGHSSALIEEHYLTAPPARPPPVPLTRSCPNLREFICSADAEWHWEHPDWIVPHILLPAHPKLTFIGIRDIDKRLRDDAEAAPAAVAYVPLRTQIRSLLHAAAFPQLRYIRDLSAQSDEIRRTVPDVHVLEFWRSVLARCHERGVWLEDHRGVNITVRDLQRAERSLMAAGGR